MAKVEPVHTRALIIGAGFSGLGMSVELDKHGIDYRILEKAGDVGGTWLYNSYPGCACDVPSHMYSYSFYPKSDWKHLFSFQPEILEYLKDFCDNYDLRGNIVFNTEVVRAEWNNAEYRWHVYTTDGNEYVAQFLISGAGPLHVPSIPDIEGRDEFAGAAFHSAEWDHDVDLTGKRVAVVGTGASALQIVPEIVNQVGQLQLYQRTPAWVLPRKNIRFPRAVQLAFKTVPGLRRSFRYGIYWFQEGVGFGMVKRRKTLKVLEAAAKRRMHSIVRDPDLRAKLTPDYDLGCKRIGNGAGAFYKAIVKPNSQLITEGISSVTRDGIVTADGIEHKVDVIVWATGFHVTDSYKYVDIKTVGGEDLVDRFNTEGIAALRGTTVADVPNLFLLLGPNTGLGHNSVVIMIESQIRYIAQAIKAVDKREVQALAPTRKAQDKFNEKVQAKLAGSVWNYGSCSSWYMDEHGVNASLWSGYTWQYRLATRKLIPKEYKFSGVGKAAR